MYQETYYIYTLSDETGVRYVGQTNSLSIRFSSHKCNARYGRDKTPRGIWIKSILDQKQEPIIEAIDRCTTREEARDKEKYWLNYYCKQGCNLVNRNLNPNPLAKFSTKQLIAELDRRNWGGVREGAGYPKGQPRKATGQ